MQEPFFSISITAARNAIALRYPDAQPHDSTEPGNAAGYILHLCQRITDQPRKLMAGAAFASWHAGRMVTLCEALGLWDKEQSYALLAQDFENKNHLPKSR